MKHLKLFENFLNEAEAKITFKTDNPKGKYKSFDSYYHNIKLNGKNVGDIDDKKPHQIRVMVLKTDKITDDNPNCKWKWIKFAAKFESLQGAKDWFLKNAKDIMEKYTLNPLD